MSNKQSIDLKDLLTNFKELDEVSHRISMEMDRKNRILRGGLQDCDACKKYIEHNKKIIK